MRGGGSVSGEFKSVHSSKHIETKKGALDPDKYIALNGVNTQVAEQFFSNLLKLVVSLEILVPSELIYGFFLILHHSLMIDKYLAFFQ